MAQRTKDAPRTDAAPRYAGLFGRDERTPESFWISLRYFNIYRMAVAALFLGITLFYGDSLNLGSHQLNVFRSVSVAYLMAGVVFHSLLRYLRDLFNLQLSLHIGVDIVAITLLMYASGGIRSGLGVMLLIALTGAALVAPRRLSLLYAALAAIALLLEQSYWLLRFDAPGSELPAARAARDRLLCQRGRHRLAGAARGRQRKPRARARPRARDAAARQPAGDRRHAGWRAGARPRRPGGAVQPAGAAPARRGVAAGRWSSPACCPVSANAGRPGAPATPPRRAPSSTCAAAACACA